MIRAWLCVLFVWLLCAEQKCEVKADDLEQICELGRGAYGVVDKMRHVPSGLIMAVKVSQLIQHMILFTVKMLSLFQKTVQSLKSFLFCKYIVTFFPLLQRAQNLVLDYLYMVV